MTVRIPPTSALRALEASARHLSFTLAAEELFVTQSAVSHQIKLLESLWEIRLFERKGRKLILTESGHAVVPVVRDFIRRLTSTIEEITQSEDNSLALRITLLQSFAYKWLVPRLGHFSQEYPDINIWISTSDELVNLHSTDADAGIRLGYGNWGNIYKEHLLKEYIFPVCSPRFLIEHGNPNKPEDILKLPLLRRFSVDILERWRDWFKVANVPVNRMPKGTHFPQTSMALQAAIDDQGIALARSAHVLDDIKAGRLVRLFPEVKCKSEVSYYFVCGPGRENESQIAAFRIWLKQEADKSQEEFEELFIH